MSVGGMQRGMRGRRWVWLAVAGLALSNASAAAAQGVDPWTKGRQWLSVRAGYARSGAEGAADGNFGAGFGYSRFRNTKWSFGASAHIDVLGRFGDASEVESSWTAEVARHYKWNTSVRPYLGAGLGAYYHKIQGTTDDYASILPGGFLMSGFNAPISDHGLLGIDVRANLVEIDHQTNPVFGGLATTGKDQNRVIHWGAKVGYSWAF